MPLPRDGDIVVSKATARVEYEVLVVPSEQVLWTDRREAAVDRARQLADERGVDAWLTADHTHFLEIATHRRKPARRF